MITQTSVRGKLLQLTNPDSNVSGYHSQCSTITSQKMWIWVVVTGMDAHSRLAESVLISYHIGNGLLSRIQNWWVDRLICTSTDEPQANMLHTGDDIRCKVCVSIVPRPEPKEGV